LAFSFGPTFSPILNGALEAIASSASFEYVCSICNAIQYCFAQAGVEKDRVLSENGKLVMISVEISARSDTT
jgi:hypothetical protein